MKTFAAGGSVASKLQAAPVPLISAADCTQYYGVGITQNMLCAGYPNLGGIDSCQVSGEDITLSE